MIYLVSYPHSGNTWVRYCFEFLTQLPTHGHRKFSISERDKNFLNVDLDKDPILIKRHTLEDITEKDVFVLLLRDPSECIKSFQDVNKEFLQYYSLIKGFELHRGPFTTGDLIKQDGPGAVLYYKWIFDRHYLTDVIKYYDFFSDKVEKDRLELLYRDWDYHLERCRSIYNNKTDKEGADLSEISQILLDHELIKNTRGPVYS